MSRNRLSVASAHPAVPAETAGVAAGLPSLIETGSGELVEAAVRRVLEDGHPVFGESGFAEVLNQTLCQTDPRRRVMASPVSSFNPAVAVARLVWHLAGDSDLDAIEFYEPRARLFSDDGRVLPGSNTGARVFGDVNQVGGLISRLAADANSRRAMAVVWRPEDAIRESRDIPCTLALACHVREGSLVTTVTMRSNNALRLLPYNLFEFTMLAELIAVELGVDLGSYWHSALSLHVFDADKDAAADLLRAGQAGGVPMPPMPAHPLLGATALVAHERRLRGAFRSRRWEELPSLADRAGAELHPYWFGLYAVLALFACKRVRPAASEIDLGRLEEAVPAALRPPHC